VGGWVRGSARARCSAPSSVPLGPASCSVPRCSARRPCLLPFAPFSGASRPVPASAGPALGGWGVGAAAAVRGLWPGLLASPSLRHHKVCAEGPEHRTIPYGEALTSSETLPAIGWRLHRLRRDEHLSSAKRDCPPSRRPSSWISPVSGWGSGDQNVVPNDAPIKRLGRARSTVRFSSPGT